MPLPQLSQPRRMGSLPVMRIFRIPGTEHFVQSLQRHGAIAYYGHIDFHILADGGRINIDMDNLRLGSECFQPARNAVVKTRTRSNDEIRLVYRLVGRICTMHAQHAKEQRIVPRKRAQSHQSGRYGNGKVVRKSAQFSGSVGTDDAPPRPKKRTR